MKSTNPEISIILPVYNAGQYLRKCLDTLIHQTLNNIEIIIVTDCPTDGSELICKEYASKSEKIVLIENQTNLHIGQARNIGLSAAKGKYVAFSDHDDYRELNMYEKLLSCAEINQSEIIFGMPVTIQNDQILLHPAFKNKNEYSIEHLLKDLISGGDDLTNTPIITNIHPNIYLREFLISNNILFPDTKTTTPEDRIFQLKCLLKSTRISFQHDELYYHRIYNESSGKNLSYLSCKTRANGKMMIYNILNEENVFFHYKYLFYNATKKEISNCLIDEFWQNKNIIKFYKDIQHFKKNEVFRTSFRLGNNNLKHFRLSGRLFRKIIAVLMQI